MFGEQLRHEQSFQGAPGCEVQNGSNSICNGLVIALFWKVCFRNQQLHDDMHVQGPGTQAQQR